MKWLSRTIKAERRCLERARRRFVREPTQERLHDLRTTGRRLRSLLEDVADVIAKPALLRRLKRAAALTDAARDAAVIVSLLAGSLDEAERHTAQPLLDALERRLHSATTKACRRLQRVRFS